VRQSVRRCVLAAGVSRTQMKAVTRGAALTFKSDVAVPRIKKPTEVLVSIRAAAINPVDYKAPKMLLGPIVGLDFSGVVEVVGAGVKTLAVGDAVYGTAPGTLAEFVVVDASRIAKKPASLSFAQAAAMPTAYLTSLQSLRAAGMSTFSKVLVIGASGGCGSAGIQIAKTLGAKEIVGVCSGKNAEVVKEMGAHRIIDYQTQSLVNETSDYDVVYDTATNSGAGENYRASGIKLLAPVTSGRRPQYVAINGGLSVWLRKFMGCEQRGTHLIITDANTKDLELLAQMVDSGDAAPFFGKLSPTICKTFPFESAAIVEGFELLKSRRAVGKIVFQM